MKFLIKLKRHTKYLKLTTEGVFIAEKNIETESFVIFRESSD